MRNKLYYFDTSIWIDFFENRDEPNFPKGTIIRKLIQKILDENSRILYSDTNLFELRSFGYTRYQINYLIKPIQSSLIFVKATEKEFGKAKDISFKRSIPKGDVLHALIARNNGAILIALDHHFKRIKDIKIPIMPQDAIYF